MKKRYKIFMTFLFCGVTVILLTLVGKGLGDNTVLTHVIDDSCTLHIRKESLWEYSVPVYLTIDRKGEKTLESTNFYYYYPKEIESKELGLEINKIDSIILVYLQRNPNEILALVDIEGDLIYPGIAGDNPDDITLYYGRVRDFFSKVKKLLENDDLELSGYPQDSPED